MVGTIPSNTTPSTDTWIDGTSGDWSLSANWSGALVPGGSSNAAIVGTGTEAVTVSTYQAVNALTLNDPNATLSIDNFAMLTANGGLTVSALQQLNLLGTLSVGGGTLDNAAISIGGLVQMGPIGFPPTATSGTLNLQSGSLTFGTNLTVNIAYGGINSFLSPMSGFSLINDGTITADTSGGTGYVGATLDNEHSVAVSNGDTLNLYSGVTNNGTISVGSDGHLTVDYGSGSGQFIINNGGTLELSGTLSNAVSFATGAVGTLALDSFAGPDPLTGTLSGLGAGDTIDFIDQTVTGAVVQGNTLTATLANGQTTSLTIAGPLPAGYSLETKLDGTGGSDVVVATGPLPPPATYSWIDGTSGSWNIGSDWSGGVVPNGASNAKIAGTGSETITISDSEAANILTLNNANATLDVAVGGALTAYGGLTVSAAQQIDILGSLSLGINAASFDNTTITIGGLGPTPPGFPAILTMGNLNAQGAVTFGPNVNVNLIDGQIDLSIASHSILVNQGTITADTSGGTGQIQAATFDNEGTISVSSGEKLTLLALGVGPSGQTSSVNNGTISVGSGGHLTLSGQIDGSGSFDIDDGGVLEISGAVSNVVNFATGVGTLELDDVADGSPLTGTVSGLATGDAIDFTDVTVTQAVLSGDTLVATLADGQTVDLTVAGSLPAGDTLQLKLDGSGGTDVVVTNGALPPPATYTWIDGTSGDWSNGSNWSGGPVPGGIPDGTSNATIAGTGVETVNVSTGTANLLTINDANATLVVETFANLSAFGGLDISAAQEIDVFGILTVGGAAQTYDNTTIKLGGFPGGPSITTGYLDLQPGTLVTFGTNLTVDLAHAQIDGFSSSGYSLINDGSIVADTQGGSGNIDVSAFDNEGTITVSNDDILTLSVQGFVTPSVNDGIVTVGSGGHLTLQGSIGGSGSFEIQDDGTLEISGTLFNDINFATGATGTLRLDQPYYGGASTGAITGFTASDSIYLANLAFDGQGSAELLSGNLLQVTDNFTVYDLQLAPTESFAGDFFELSSAGTGGTLVTEQPADVIVTNGETTTVPAATTAQNVYVDSGGMLDVAGGVTNVIVASGGAETISNCGSASTIDDFGLVTLQSGGTVDGLTVESGGVLDFAGTVLSNVVVSAGGTVNVLSGGVLSGTSASYINVSSGQTLDVQSGGTAEFFVVVNGGTVEVEGTVFDRGVLAGGLEIVSSGGVAGGAPSSGTGVTGGTVDVLSGGQLSYATVASGGVVNLSSGATANNVTVSSGGTMNVAGTLAHNQAVMSGGLEFVSSGGVVTGTSGNGTAISGGQVTVLSGGELDHATISSGGILDIDGGATAQHVTVSSGGTLIDQGTLTGNITVSSGGTLEIMFGGKPGAFNLVSGAILEAGAGYQFKNEVVSNGLTLELAAGGTASGTTIDSGGIELVFSGGTDNGATISGGGTQNVASGGTTIDTLVDGAVLGAQYVLSGGTASNTTIDGNDIQEVESGGAAYGINLLNGGTEQIDSGGTTTIYDGDLLSGAVLDNGRLIVDLTGMDHFDGSLSGSGSLVVEGGGTLLVSGGDAFAGTTDIYGGGVLDVVGAAVGSVINFEDANGAASLDGSAAAGATIEGFQPGDTIDLPNLSYATLSASSPSYQTVGNDTRVTISADDATTGKPASETLIFAGDYAGHIQLVSDNNGGVLVENVICFMAGTMIATPSGETPIETLQRGDLVMTMDGRAMPVSWLGKQTVSALFADPLRSWPIRVRAGALGQNVPSRDLLLSPCHALLVEEVLIQAGALVNGMSIVLETHVPEVFTYYHVELDDHSLILAENTPAETFVDNIDRMKFDNWAEHEALYPDGKPIEEMPYPRAKARRQVPMSVRASLDERANMISAKEPSAAA